MPETQGKAIASKQPFSHQPFIIFLLQRGESCYLLTQEKLQIIGSSTIVVSFSALRFTDVIAKLNVVTVLLHVNSCINSEALRSPWED